MALQEYKALFRNGQKIGGIYQNGNLVWPAKMETGPDYTEPFYVQDMSGAANTIQIYQTDSNAPTLTIEQSVDKSAWTLLGTTGSTPLDINLQANGKVYLRCSTNRWSSTYDSKQNSFKSTTGYYKVGGNIMSLIYGSSFTGSETSFPENVNHLFCNLFYRDTYLRDASKLILSAKTLPSAHGVYGGMFQYCSSLLAGPIIDAEISGQYSFADTFSYCTSLTVAPELHLTTTAANCCENMFRGCTALTTPPSIIGLSTSNPYAGSCASMFRDCTSLTTAPKLPAGTLGQDAYNSMFRGCTSLNYVECLATSGINSSNSTANWLNGVALTGTFVKAAGVTWPTGVNGIPSGWTVVEE